LLSPGHRKVFLEYTQAISFQRHSSKPANPMPAHNGYEINGISGQASTAVCIVGFALPPPDYFAYYRYPTNYPDGGGLPSPPAIFAFTSFTLKESTYSTMLAIFNVPLSSFVKLKRNNIPWVNGPCGKARLTFAYRGGASELTDHSQRLDPPAWTAMNKGRSMTLASSNWENRQFSVTSPSFCNGIPTSTDCAAVSKRVIWACHPTLLNFSPTLHQNTQYSGGATTNVEGRIS
jgi:hypothetical protein